MKAHRVLLCQNYCSSKPTENGWVSLKNTFQIQTMIEYKRGTQEGIDIVWSNCITSGPEVQELITYMKQQAENERTIMKDLRAFVEAKPSTRIQACQSLTNDYGSSLHNHWNILDKLINAPEHINYNGNQDTWWIDLYCLHYNDILLTLKQTIENEEARR